MQLRGTRESEALTTGDARPTPGCTAGAPAQRAPGAGARPDRAGQGARFGARMERGPQAAGFACERESQHAFAGLDNDADAARPGPGEHGGRPVLVERSLCRRMRTGAKCKRRWPIRRAIAPGHARLGPLAPDDNLAGLDDVGIAGRVRASSNFRTVSRSIGRWGRRKRLVRLLRIAPFSSHRFPPPSAGR